MAAAAASRRKALMLSAYCSSVAARLASAVVPLLRSSSSSLKRPGSPRGSSAYLRHVSQLHSKSNGKRAFLVDTLALVRKLEAQGIPSREAEAFTSVITEILNGSLENVTQSFISQEHHFFMLQLEMEKLKNDIYKMHSELRYEKDEVNCGLRLDLIRERGRIRDELAKQNSEISDLTSKLDMEIHMLKCQLVAMKIDAIKYCYGTFIFMTAVGFTIARVMV